MKYIITQNQYDLLIEQISDQEMERRMKGVKAVFDDTIGAWCKKNFTICLTAGQFVLWFIPGIGPYLAASLGMVDTVRLYKEGKNVEAFISFATSPLIFGKLLRVTKLLNINHVAIDVIRNIHKSGLTVLFARGQEVFYNHIYQKILEELKKRPEYKNKDIEQIAADSVDKFKKLLMDKQTFDVVETTIKEKSNEWKKQNMELYNSMNPKYKKAIDSATKI